MTSRCLATGPTIAMMAMGLSTKQVSYMIGGAVPSPSLSPVVGVDEQSQRGDNHQILLIARCEERSFIFCSALGLLQ